MSNIFDGIKVGDRIWVGRDNKKTRIETVTRRTPTLISTGAKGSDGKYYNTYRISQSKYNEDVWYCCGLHGGWFKDSVIGVAGEIECQMWDTKQADDKAKQEAKEAAHTKRANKQAELRELFAPSNGKTNGVYVRDAEWTEHRVQDRFDVTFHGLTEQQVRKLAEIAKAEPTERIESRIC